MDSIREYVERFFETRIPISKQNRKVMEAFLAEVIKEYYELQKENTDENCIEILKRKYGWTEELNSGFGGVCLSIDGLTLSENGMIFDPSDETYELEKIHQLLMELCGISFCYTRKKSDFQFDCSEKFVVFALDENRNYFGSIGDYCNIETQNVPIGYVRQEGLFGRIANHLKEFLELSVFYPYWYDVIRFQGARYQEALDELEREWVKKIPDFYKKQTELSAALNIQKNDKSLEILFDNLMMKDTFQVGDINEDSNKMYFKLYDIEKVYKEEK